MLPTKPDGLVDIRATELDFCGMELQMAFQDCDESVGRWVGESVSRWDGISESGP